jgi:hypothetical protein
MNDESKVKGAAASEDLEPSEDLGFLRLLGVALLGFALGALATGYALRGKALRGRPIKPDFSLTVDTSTTTIKLVDEQGKTVGEIRDWKADPIVVRIQRNQ